MDPEQQDILLGFIEEGREMIDEVEPLLIELEQTAEESGEVDLEKVNTVFRLFHSLKGGAGFLDLNTVSEVTHVAETLLDMFRKGNAVLTSGHIDLMNRACDFLRKLLEQIETEFHDKGFEDEAKEIAGELQTAIETLKDGGEAAEATEAETLPATPSPEPEDEAAAVEDSQPSTEEPIGAAEPESEPAPPPPGDELQLAITPEMLKQFTNEAEEMLERAEQSLLSLEKSPGDEDLIQQAFRELHSFKGNAGFLGYGDMETLSHGAESVLDKFRDKSLEPSEQVLTHILEIIDFLRNAVSSVSEGGSASIPATSGLLHLLEDFSGTTIGEPVGVSGSAAPKPVEMDEEAASEEAVEELPEGAVKSNGQEAAPEPEPAPKQQQASKAESKPEVKTPDPAKTAAASRAPGKSAQQRQSVRVDVEKLDILLDLVGELVISEAMVAQNPDLKDVDASLDRFEKAVMHLDKITRDIQDIATSIRMIPLSGTFRRMVRLVRDLSQKAHKKVEFVIEGEETEVDKTVIEQITDPLIHIIRNSIDHGLETPEDREATGKSGTGRLLIEAKYVGGEVWIVIEDDGRGLNRERILSKALERGLIEGDPAELRDEQVWQYIFNPGFSTAEKITDVSGRGVGMDVVKRNIENIRGKIDVYSTPGKGTQTILRIPLTLAIIDGMLVRIGDGRYTIPITAIKESLQVNREKLTKTMDGQEIIKIRDSLIPIVRMHELLGTESNMKDLEDGILTVVENEGNLACLFVDELLGQQQIVIKGMSDYVGDHPCVSGCTILGDGDISLILDVAGIIEQAKSGTSSLPAPDVPRSSDVVTASR